MRKPDDKSLEERLRQVPVPPSLAVRLRGIADWDDAHLDHALRDVFEPPGLRHRLRQIVLDQQVDDRLQDVRLPSVVVARARIIPQRRVRSRLGRLALAASLLVVLTLGYGGWLGGVLWLVRPVERPALTLYVMDRGPLELVSPSQSAVAIVPGPVWDDGRGFADSESWPPDAFPLLATLDRLPAGPAGQLFAEWGSEWDPGVQWVRLRWPVFGYLHPEAATLPDLELVQMPAPRGIPVSLNREFDREFLFSRGASPPVLNPVDSDLRRLKVPLSSGTCSWDRLRAQLQGRRFSASDPIHADHFLAALDHRLAPPEPGKLALRSAAGVSVFNPYPAGLLQIGVKAGEPRHWPRPATHLTVALDLSASMDWDQRFAVVREGMIRALSHLRPDDRFSLIVFREQPHLLIHEARSDGLAAVFSALDELQPAGSANVGEVLPQAIAAALETQADSVVERQLVLITDSPAMLVPEASLGLERVVRDAQAFGFDVLDLGDRDEPDPQIVALVQAAGGMVHRVRCAQQVRQALLDSLRGASELVARRAELTVDFNPEAVAAYRLIGHQGRSSGSFGSAEVVADFRTGDEVTALFEVWLHPNEVDDVATARLDWLDPHGGVRHGFESIRISRLQFSSTFEGMAISLQQAAIIAEAAEVLSHSFNFEVLGTGGYRYLPKPRDLRHVFRMVERANPQLRQRADFQRMLGYFEPASRITPERPVASTRSGVRGIIAGRWRESRE
jgi:hypothetical protein